jgi:hypothetical protein
MNEEELWISEKTRGPTEDELKDIERAYCLAVHATQSSSDVFDQMHAHFHRFAWLHIAGMVAEIRRLREIMDRISAAVNLRGRSGA